MPDEGDCGGYHLHRLLGRGGMADVLLASSGSPELRVLHVIKKLRQDLVGKRHFEQMFATEARLTAQFRHPNIVAAHDVHDDFIVLEYLDGKSLWEVFEKATSGGGNLPPEVSVHLICEVLEGLSYAHNLKSRDDVPLNIIHRDVSPQNIFVTFAGHIKLLDFGIAKARDSVHTVAGQVKGKWRYAAPEQLLQHNLDCRADLYSVGVVLWELLAGRRMFAGCSDPEVVGRVTKGELPSLRQLAAHLPEQLLALVEGVLSLDRDRRHDSATEMRLQLRELAAALPRVSNGDVGRFVAALFQTEVTHVAVIDDVAKTGGNPTKVMATEPTKVAPSERTKAVSDEPTKPFAALAVDAGDGSPSETPPPAKLVPAPSSSPWPWLILIPAILSVLVAVYVARSRAEEPAAASAPTAVLASTEPAGLVAVATQQVPDSPASAAPAIESATGHSSSQTATGSDTTSKQGTSTRSRPPPRRHGPMEPEF